MTAVFAKTKEGPMEKLGVVAEGITPPAEEPKEGQKQASLVELADCPENRMAEALSKKVKPKTTGV
jgi:hypothetical protein